MHVANFCFLAFLLASTNSLNIPRIRAGLFAHPSFGKASQQKSLELSSVALNLLSGLGAPAEKVAARALHGIPSEDPFTHLANDVSKIIQAYLRRSDNPSVMAVMGAWRLLPKFWKNIFTGMAFGDFFLFILFQLTYRRASRMAHQLQILAWKWLALGTPLEFKKSILGFTEERGGLLAKIMGCNYLLKIVVRFLQKLGFRIDAGLPVLLSKIAYTMYAVNFIDLFKSQFLHTFFPNLAENRRQSYVVNRSTSVIIWVVGVLAACEMVSTYFKVPLSSTLAFGGVGGIAIGLSARDIAANFLGGMLLLFNEPFTPGDMVTFRSGNTECVGRVERVGWGQTRIRGRDTRPTYVPNSHFVQTAVTNMERITHRKFEATIPLRFQDHSVMPEILTKIKESLRTLPKLDVLSMPFRVSFVKFGAYALEIEITCYFATKSIDEFLALQQMANLEIVRVIRECGAQLALPTTLIHMPASVDAIAIAQSNSPAQMPTISPQLIAKPVPVVGSGGASGSGAPPQAPLPPAQPTLPKVETSKKKDLPPLATVAAATTTAAAYAAAASRPTQPIPVSTSSQSVVVAAAVPAISAVVGGPTKIPDSSVANLSPAAAAILAQAQAGSYIAETLSGRVSPNSPIASTVETQRRVVVGQTVKGGPPASQDPRIKGVESSVGKAETNPNPLPKIPIPPSQPQLPQQPLPPTASTPPSPSIAVTGQIGQQALQLQQFQQQQQLQMQRQQQSQAQPLLKQRPVFAKDGSISWSWIEIEASIVDEEEEAYRGNEF